ncbi:hypothetical protein MTR67_043437 [Solanum verrucosum]|uniref:Reverse transcriptase/retrotransposon-derived protein RNase H-like domain-containing protein n=1 Tax=Solanum verrucosum TaxID=315347 RepID=A0AAF0UPN7_SOLVR|nr:hypothetical protein MTR67_043437 [Solanum verrucosum]
MLSIFVDMGEDLMGVFMDDFSIVGYTFEVCLENLGKIVQRCVKTNLVLNWEKCHFIGKEGTVLGHKYYGESMQVDQAKFEVIAKFPPPILIKGVRSFLGHAGFFRRFIKDFSKFAYPLCKLLEKECIFELDEACVKEFLSLKEKFVSAPIIVAPDWIIPFELMCDVSGVALGVVLDQCKINFFHSIYYASKTLNVVKKNYTVTEQELFAMAYAFEKFKAYLLGIKVVVLT